MCCREVTMVFKNVCKEVPALGQTQTVGAKPEMKQILFHVSGAIKPGEVVALMVRLQRTTQCNVAGSHRNVQTQMNHSRCVWLQIDRARLAAARLLCSTYSEDEPWQA